MNLKIICWNVRGLNNAEKRLNISIFFFISNISNLLKIWKPDVVCFQETKMESIFGGIVRSLWRGSFMGWTVLPASRASSGFLLI